MKLIYVEKHDDFQFDSESQATIRINSLVLPDLVLKGTKILEYPLYLKPINGDLKGLDIICNLTPEMIQRGVILLGAYLDGDSIRIGINGDCRIPENMDSFKVSFHERVQIRSVVPMTVGSGLSQTINEVITIEESKQPKTKKGKK